MKMFANLNLDDKPRDEIEGCWEKGVGWVKVRQVRTTAVSTKISGGTVIEWKERKDALWLQKILKPAVVVACDPSTGHAFQASLHYILSSDSKMTSKSRHGKGGKKMRNRQRRFAFFFHGLFILLYSRKGHECHRNVSRRGSPGSRNVRKTTLFVVPLCC